MLKSNGKTLAEQMGRGIEEKARPGLFDVHPLDIGKKLVHQGPIPGIPKMYASAGALEFISPGGAAKAPGLLSRIRGLFKPKTVAPTVTETTAAGKVIPQPTPQQLADVSRRAQLATSEGAVADLTKVPTTSPPIPKGAPKRRVLSAAEEPVLPSEFGSPGIERKYRYPRPGEIRERTQRGIPSGVRGLPEHKGMSPYFESHPQALRQEKLAEEAAERAEEIGMVKIPPAPRGPVLEEKYRQAVESFRGITPASREAATKQTMEELTAKRAAEGKPPFFKSLIELNKSITAFWTAAIERL